MKRSAFLSDKKKKKINKIASACLSGNNLKCHIFKSGRVCLLECQYQSIFCALI